jgi:hypothetical protein
MGAELLDVAEQVMRGICRQVDVRLAGVGCATSAVALVEQDDVICARIERPRCHGADLDPGPPCNNTAALPMGLPDSSEYIL